MLPSLIEKIGENAEAGWQRLVQLASADPATKLLDYYKRFRLTDVKEAQAKKAVTIVLG